MQLNFSDQLLLIDFSEYDEVALLSHINACHTIADQLPSHNRINGDREEMVRGRISCKEGAKEEKSKEFGESRSKRNCDNDGSEFTDAVADRASDSTSVCTSIELNLAATDSVRCACLSSARMAVVHAVQLAGKSVSGLLSMFFKEKKGSAWIGDKINECYRTILIECPSHFLNHHYDFISRRRCLQCLPRSSVGLVEEFIGIFAYTIR